MSSRRIVLSVVASAWLAGCHSPGMYGHSRIYSPLGDEEKAANGAQVYDPSAQSRGVDDLKGKPISAFGVVKTRADGKGGAVYLTLSVRALSEKNACKTNDEDSCRVTVSAREHALLHAHVKLRGEDDIGKLHVGAGSLLRVVGVVSDDVDPDDGAPVVRATYYRHWPRNYYATQEDQAGGDCRVLRLAAPHGAQGRQ